MSRTSSKGSTSSKVVADVDQSDLVRRAVPLIDSFKYLSDLNIGGDSALKKSREWALLSQNKLYPDFNFEQLVMRFAQASAKQHLPVRFPCVCGREKNFGYKDVPLIDEKSVALHLISNSNA